MEASRIRRSRSAIRDPFGCALLMPEEEVWAAAESFALDMNDEAAMRRAARHFGVSVQALSYRLANLRVPIDGAAEF